MDLKEVLADHEVQEVLSARDNLWHLPQEIGKGAPTVPLRTKKVPNLNTTDDVNDPEQPDEEKKCCICLEEPDDHEAASINGCHHVFCFGCIEKWAARENSCPLCKSRFTKIERVAKCPNGKRRKKGDPPRPKNCKRVNHRDQRSDYLSTNPLHALFAPLEGVMNSSLDGQLRDFLIRGGPFMHFNHPSASARVTRTTNGRSNIHGATRANPISLTITAEGHIDPEIGGDVTTSLVTRLNNSGHEESVLEVQVGATAPPNIRERFNQNAHIHVFGGPRVYNTPAHRTAPASNFRSPVSEMRERIGSMRQALIQMVRDESESPTPVSGGNTADTAIEIDDSDSEE